MNLSAAQSTARLPPRLTQAMFLGASGCCFLAACLALFRSSDDVVVWLACASFVLTFAGVVNQAVVTAQVAWSVTAFAVMALVVEVHLLLPPRSPRDHPVVWALVGCAILAGPLGIQVLRSAPLSVRRNVQRLVAVPVPDKPGQEATPDFLADQFMAADWKGDASEVVRIVVSESFLPVVGLAALAVTLAFALAHTHQIAQLLSQFGAPDPTPETTPASRGLWVSAVAGAIFQTARIVWERSRRRNALCVAIAKELVSSLQATAGWADFDRLRDRLTAEIHVRPIIAAENRPWLFLNPGREALIDLHADLLGPIVVMLDADHALTQAYAQLASDAFHEASRQRRTEFTNFLVDLATDGYFPSAREAVYKLLLYIAIRRVVLI